MISMLAQVMAARLQGVFDTVKVQAAPFASAPGKTAVPALAVYPGKFLIQQVAREVTPAMREVTISQNITLGQQKTGPYPLDAPPKAGSVRPSLMVANNPPAPLAPADFSVDYTRAIISFPTNKTATGNLVMVEFTSVQVTRQREFQQELWMDAYDLTGADAEKWAGLACSVAINTTDELLTTVNDGGSSRKKTFSVAAVIKQFQLTEGLPLFSDSVPGYRLKFAVTGDLRFTQMFPDSPALIKEVVINQQVG